MIDSRGKSSRRQEMGILRLFFFFIQPSLNHNGTSHASHIRITSAFCQCLAGERHCCHGDTCGECVFQTCVLTHRLQRCHASGRLLPRTNREAPKCVCPSCVFHGLAEAAPQQQKHPIYKHNRQKQVEIFHRLGRM